MIICSCRAVSDRTVKATVGSGAASIDDVTDRCGAGGLCGGCWPALQQLIDEHDAQRGDLGRTSAA